MRKTEYIYSATVRRVIDGDTVVIDIDAGFGIIFQSQVCRLHKVYALEPIARYGQSQDEVKLGKTCTQTLEDILPVGTACVIRTLKNRKEKYGRYLAEIFVGDDIKSVNERLLDIGAPLFLNYEQDVEMKENRKKEMEKRDNVE